MSKLFNRCLSVFLCLIIFFPLLSVKNRPLAAADHIFIGQGTKEDPFLISSVQDLEQLARCTSENEQVYDDSHYALSCDLDLSATPFLQLIGSKHKPFLGTFDGRGHTIFNLAIAAEAKENNTYGLFGSNAGVIENLTLANVDIRIHVPKLPDVREGEAGIVNVGAVAGFNSGIIRSVSVNGKLVLVHDTRFEASSAIGGLVGQNEGKIIHVHNAASVSFSSLAPLGEEAVGYAGGICGVNDIHGLIRQASNTGLIKNENGPSFVSSAGGIAGRNNQDIELAMNDAKVSCEGAGSAGGIAGHTSNGSISNSYNLGAIDAGFAGGLAGTGMRALIDKSYNAGPAKGTDAEASLLAAAYFDTIKITDSYYLDDGATALGEDLSYGSCVVEADALSINEMQRSDSFLSFDWTDVWCSPPPGINRGFPAFRYLVCGRLHNTPDKQDYLYGEAFDTKGASVCYRLGSMAESIVPLDIETVSGFDPYQVGEQRISVGTPFFQDEFTIRVHDYPIRLHLVKAPDKLRYELHEALELDGLRVDVETAAGFYHELDVTADMISGYNPEQSGLQAVKIDYKNLSTSFEVIVSELNENSELNETKESIGVEESNSVESQTSAGITESSTIEVSSKENESTEEPTMSVSSQSNRPSTPAPETIPATGRGNDVSFVAWPIVLLGVIALAWIAFTRQRYN